MRNSEIVRVYKCLCDLTRLRILNLLIEGPLCVCHIQSILKEPEPKISRLLNLMKKSGLLASSREYNWSIYRIADKPSSVLTSNLQCLQDVRAENELLRRDLEIRRKVMDRLMKSGDCLPKAMQSCQTPTKRTPTLSLHRKSPQPSTK